MLFPTPEKKGNAKNRVALNIPSFSSSSMFPYKVESGGIVFS
jgi:hypothetical protein